MWQRLDWETVMRWGWYIFILDIPRFFILEGITLLYSRVKRMSTRSSWDKAADALWSENPLVTVLVPGHNEGKHLYKLIQSMKSQTYKNIELIVVDDGSTDNTALIARSFERRGEIDRFLSATERGGKASAANLGLRYSKGTYVVHLDADSSLDSDAIEKILIPFYRYQNVGAVGGNLMVRNEEQSLTATMQFLEYLQSINVSRIVLSQLGIYKLISGAFGAFPKNVLDRVGGWDVGPGLDGDLTVKIRKLNYRIVFEEEAICKTHVPITWRALTKQRLRWSRSLVRFRIRKHKDIWMPDKHFNFSNFFSFFENIFFGLILDAFWVYYMIKIILVDPQFLLIWFPFKYSIYVMLASGQFLYSIAIAKNKYQVWSKVLYLPLYPIYMGYYMRIVRTIAYIDEFLFFDSYKDPWNPNKTSQKARENNM